MNGMTRGTLRWGVPVFAVALVGTVGTVVAGDEPSVIDGDASGFGWKLKRLDLDVTIHPKDKKINVEGKAALTLALPNSMGPSLAVNARQKILQWTRLDGPEGCRSEINKTFLLWPPARLANVRCERPFAKGDSIEVPFAYESLENASQFHIGPKLAIASWVEAWHPVPVIRPDSADASASQLTTGTTRIRMPKDWHSASDGAFVGREETDDLAVETWEVTTPIKRSFAAGPFEVVRQKFGEREVGVYLLSNKPDGAAEQAKALADAIAAMEARFGPFPYPSYSIVEVPDDMFTWYAASQQSFILAQSSAFQHEGGNLPLFAHEAAHAWWGNLIGTSGPGGVLCSESLAQYSAVIAIEAMEGEAAATEFLRFSRTGYNSIQCARGYFEMAERGEDMPLSKLGSGGWQHNLSDAKGHWVFHMLRRRVGDELFFSTMRSLIKEFANRRITLDDVREAFVKAAPAKSRLKQFFKQWLDRKGAPILEVEWADASSSGKLQAKATIRQVQKGRPYELRLEVAVDSEEGTKLSKVRLTKRVTQVTLAAKGKPTEVRLDPKHRLLIWTPEYGEKPTRLVANKGTGKSKSD